MLRFFQGTGACTCLLALSSLTAGEHKDDALPFREIILSRRDLGSKPRLVSVPGAKAYAVWFDVQEPDRERFRASFLIQPYDLKKRDFSAAYPAFPIDAETGVGAITRTALTLLLLPSQKDGSPPVLYAVYDENSWGGGLAFPPLCFGLLEFNERKKQYVVKKLGTLDAGTPLSWSVDGQVYPPDAEKPSIFFFSAGNVQVSHNRGTVWSAPRSIISTTEVHAVAAPSGELVLFAQDGTTSPLHMLRTRDGETWSKPEATKLPSQHIHFFAPQFDKDGNIWIVYAGRKERERNLGLLLTRSSDKGKTWEKPIRLTKGDRHDVFPSLAVTETQLLILFNRLPKGAKGHTGLGTITALIIERDAIRFETEKKGAEKTEKKEKK